MSNAEPLGVAFVEIEPVATGFRAKTEAQIRTQLAGTQALVPASAGATTAQARLAAATESGAVAARQGVAAQAALTEAETAGAVAADRKAGAEARAALAAGRNAVATRATAGAIAQQSAAMVGLSGAAGGLNVPLAAAAVSAGILFKSLEEADTFNQRMRAIQVATGATAEQMEEAGRSAQRFGRDLDLPFTTAVDAATAINLLARSGFNLQESQTAARGALLLTAASGDELATSVKSVDQILDAFNLRAEDSVRVADAVATGLRFTQGNAAEFANALASIAPAADALGLSLEETSTLVLQLAESGLSAGQASGLLRQSFLRLASGTQQVKDGLATINLTTRDLIDATGKLRPDAFVRLADALRGVNRERQLEILTQIFSRRSALAVIRLVDQQRAGYERMAEAAREVGTAQAEAESRQRSFRGSLSETKDEASDLGRTLGTLATGPATDFVNTIKTMLQFTNDAAFGLQQIGDAARDMGADMASAVPGGTQLVGVMKTLVTSTLIPAQAFKNRLDFLGGAFHDLVGRWRGDADVAKATFADLEDSLAGNLQRLRDDFGATAAATTTGGGGGGRPTGIAETLATQLAVAEAAGDEDAQLRILQRMRADAQARLERNRRRADAGEISQQQVQDAANDATAADAAIQTILDRRKTDADAAAADADRRADEIADAARDRDDAFVRAIEAGFQTRVDQVTAAAADEALANDIRANIKLRNFLTSSIARIQDRIREVRAAGRSAAALVAELGDLRRARNEVRRTIEGLRDDAAEQAIQTRIESAQLDLQILQARVGTDPTQGQTRALVAAHQRVITALKRAQSLTKRRSLEWKRLQLDIENELAAIRDLKSAQDSAAGETADFSQQAFAFLQELHGFSSNLASNILPVGSQIGGRTFTSGTPSASTATAPFARPPGVPSDRVISPFEHGRGRGDSTAAAALREQRGGPATFGQMEKLVHVTQNTNALLRDIRRGIGHPESRHNRLQGKHPVETGVD